MCSEKTKDSRNSENCDPVYYDHRVDKVLKRGVCRGHEYIVRTLGFWPCAYVSVGERMPNLREIESVLDVNYYSEEFERLDFMAPGSGWIGWDYGHADEDYHPLFQTDGVKHTVEEIERDCEKVIDELIAKGY